MTDRITFKCSTCKTPVTIDPRNPPNDDDIISCTGCGNAFGTFAAVKSSLIQAGKAEINKIVRKHFGKDPDWES